MTMRPTEVKISAFMQSKVCTGLMLAVALLAAVTGYVSTVQPVYDGDAGFVAMSPNRWFADGGLSFAAGIVLLAATVGLMEVLTRVFNVMRTSSLMFIGVFALMECATPLILCRLTSGLLINVIVLAVLATYYTTYMKPRLTRRVFLSMAIMSAMCMADYLYAIYIGLFIIAFGQMRCATMRMYMAAAMGIVTPWWISLGFGWIDLEMIHWPEPVSVFEQFPKSRLILLVVTVGITVIGQFLLCVGNMMKVYSYNAKTRATGGLLMMLSLATAVATLLDFSNAPAYLSLLNCFTAFQIGHFFLINEHRRGYVAVLSAIFVYAIIFFVNLWI